MTLGFAAAFMFTILVLRKKLSAIFVCTLVALLTFAGANLFPSLVYSAPTPIRRSMQWMMLTKDDSAYGDIESSSRWRREIFLAALGEWKSDPRIFWFGRATYSFSVADQVGIKLRGWEGFLESSLRRGATHNLITDMLVTFGLVGAVVYFFLNGMITAFLWRLWKYPQNSDEATDLALVCLIFHVFNFTYGLIGGAQFPAALAWLTTALVAYHYFTLPQQSTTRPVSAIDKPARPRYPVGRGTNRPVLSQVPRSANLLSRTRAYPSSE
jgi:O-antigen ligase